MTPSVQKYVTERRADLLRRRKQLHVVAVGEYRTVATHHAIHGARQASTDGLHPASERVAVPRFDDEMRVVALKRVVHQAKARALAPLLEGSFDLVEEFHRP